MVFYQIASARKEQLLELKQFVKIKTNGKGKEKTKDKLTTLFQLHPLKQSKVDDYLLDRKLGNGLTNFRPRSTPEKYDLLSQGFQAEVEKQQLLGLSFSLQAGLEQ